MIRKTVVLASVLKPVNDPRLYERFALSMAKSNKYDVKIIGFPPQKMPVNENITCHSLGHFSRFSIKRWLTPFRILRFYIKEKPEYIIFNTPEIQLVTVLYKIIFGSKVIYDVTENYRLTFIHKRMLILLANRLLAHLIRLKERMLSRFIDHFILAEAVYESQLPFLGNRYTIAENKPAAGPLMEVLERPYFTQKKAKYDFKLLFSGTISREYGLKTALSFFELLNKHVNVSLTITGICRSEHDKALIEEYKNRYANIFSIISPYPVDHDIILSEILACDAGIMPYPLNEANIGKMPSKFYEFLALDKPLMTSYNRLWVNKLTHLQNVLLIDFTQPDINLIKETIKAIDKSTSGQIINHKYTWESEESRFLDIFTSLG